MLKNRLVVYTALAAMLAAVVRVSAQTPEIWNLPNFPIESGQFDSTQVSLTKYNCPDWFRDAKFGIWSVWGPSSVPNHGDWYARGMYLPQFYQFHVTKYGHPSVFGYKDICHLWTCDKWNPESQMQLFVETGAKYFVGYANHHGNFDCWDSKYQPWNAKTVAPKKDVVGLWAQAARKYGLPFGVYYGATPGRVWGMFSPVKYWWDTTGTYKGVPYDGRMTKADGAGKWWDGMDPVDLYCPFHTDSGNHWQLKPDHPFMRQFMWRVGDLLEKHKLDLLCFDDYMEYQLQLEELPRFPSTMMGMPVQAKAIAAHFYNSNKKWNNGKLTAVMNMKGMYKQIEKGFVQDFELSESSIIEPYPWQSEQTVTDWHYSEGGGFVPTDTIIHLLARYVSNNGNMLLNIPQRGDGSLDSIEINSCKIIGKWMKTNGDAIYGTRPFAVNHENQTRFTRKGGIIYALLLKWPSTNQLILTALAKNNGHVGVVTKVELLGYNGTVTFIQDSTRLVIQCPPGQPVSAAYVFKITQDKVWVNDDDPGVLYYGWQHACNRTLKEYMNDVHFTTAINDSCVFTFYGTGLDLISDRNSSLGAIDVYIDGVFAKNVSLNNSVSSTQSVVYTVTGLPKSGHTIKIVSKSTAMVIIDAFKVYDQYDPPVPIHESVIRSGGAPDDVTLRIQGSSILTFNNIGVSPEITVFSISGKAVRTLAVTAGRSVWDRKNSGGNPVTAGMYVVRVSGRNGNGYKSIFVRQ